MKKKIFICLWLFLVIIIALPVYANAHKRQKSATEGVLDSTGTYRYSVNEDGTATILSYQKDEKIVKIPEVLDGYVVTVIGREAFYRKLSIVDITIPETVTEIGVSAFNSLNIKKITIPESVLKIEGEAFSNCRKLKTLFIPKNVREIDSSFIIWSSKLTKIEVDSRNTVYASDDGILYSKDMTKLITVPENKDVAEFKFPDSVVEIGDFAFHWCFSLKELILPEQITFLGKAAFAGCHYLKKVVIGKNITSINFQTFMGCRNLSQVVINGNLQIIGEEAFTDCHYLSDINIPDSVTEIKRFAFYNCGRLNKITVPKNVVKIEDRAIGDSEDIWNKEICITGYVESVAYSYAKENQLAFQNIETGETLRFDLIPVAREKIKTITAGKRRIKITYKEVEEARYRIAVREAGSTIWKKYDRAKTSAIIKGLKSGKQYQIKVRALRKIEEKYYYGDWSSVKNVKVR